MPPRPSSPVKRHPLDDPHPDDRRFQRTYTMGATRVRKTATNLHPQSAAVPVNVEGVVVWKNLHTHLPVVQWDNGMRTEHHFDDITPITPITRSTTDGGQG